MLDLFAIIVSISAVFGFINHKYLKLPTTIGVMLISVLIGVLFKIAGAIQDDFMSPMNHFLQDFDFSSFVLDFVLCFLLFAGSLHVNFVQLRGARGSIISYATIGVLISTLLIGTVTYYVVQLFGYDISFIVCLLFGALISPTDPIAVIGILSKYNVPQKLKTEIIGESLFNDGVGVVVFTVIYSLYTGGEESFTVGNVLKVFSIEVIGGIFIGFTIGYIGYRLMKAIDHYQTEILITLAVVTGGWSIANLIHASGPLAMVVAGILIGNKGKKHAMSDITAEYVDKFWELIDEICNTILFVLIGFEIFFVSFELKYLAIGAVLIVVALVSRYISLLPAFFIFNHRENKKSLNLGILTWGGLRGGISIALALSMLNKVDGGSLFLVCTYCIVLFSIVVQGLSIKKLLARY
ncbi:MAG: sodium:proton antiporter [Sphingobacteriaceae bacterium]|nr:sodium:proton antiporter [Sphingobacteriaceae bacterium]